MPRETVAPLTAPAPDLPEFRFSPLGDAIARFLLAVGLFAAFATLIGLVGILVFNSTPSGGVMCIGSLAISAPLYRALLARWRLRPRFASSPATIILLIVAVAAGAYGIGSYFYRLDHPVLEADWQWQQIGPLSIEVPGRLTEDKQMTDPARLSSQRQQELSQLRAGIQSLTGYSFSRNKFTVGVSRTVVGPELELDIDRATAGTMTLMGEQIARLSGDKHFQHTTPSSDHVSGQPARRFSYTATGWHGEAAVFGDNHAVWIAMVMYPDSFSGGAAYCGRIMGSLRLAEKTGQSNRSTSPDSLATSANFDLVRLAKAATPAVVSLEVRDEKNKVLQTGTGFWISDDGKLVTNFHVLRGGKSVWAKGSAVTENAKGGAPDDPFPALTRLVGTPADGVLAYDEAADLAVVKFNLTPSAHLEMGRTRDLEIGERIAVIGSPQGLAETVSEGIVSAKRETATAAPALQITAPISPGSSGSPVFDKGGKVVGVASAYLDLPGSQGLNFAVPAEAVTALVAHISSAKPKPLDILRGEQALAEQQFSAAVLSKKATQLFREGKTDSALKVFASASKLDPAIARERLAEAKAVKDKEERILFLRELVFYHPSYADAQLELYSALLLVGNRAEAEAAWKAASTIGKPYWPKREALLNLLVHHPKLRLQEATAQQLRDMGLQTKEGKAGMAKILDVVRGLHDDRLLEEVRRAEVEADSEAEIGKPGGYQIPKAESALPGPLRTSVAITATPGP